MGHVGDGNFHLLVPFDPNDAEEKARAKDLSERVARYVNNVSFDELSQTIFLCSLLARKLAKHGRKFNSIYPFALNWRLETATA